MKSILVLGGSKGIGKGCVEYFRKLNYNVISVARTNADVLGDLCDSSFRNHIIKNYDVDIVINSAGRLGLPLEYALNINFVAIADLFTQYYEKLKPGSDIINISSIAGLYASGHHLISQERISYNVSKNAISNFCVSLSQSRKRDVRVTTIEPDMVVPTCFSIENLKSINVNNYENFNFNSYTPLQINDITKSIDWIISQPRWVCIPKLVISNHCNKRKSED